MKVVSLRLLLPDWESTLLAILSAILLILAFPDFEIWILAWFALMPLLWAVTREKDSFARSFTLGWLFGFIFFSGTCWWLTYAPINYAGFPPVIAYFLLFCLTAVVGLFPGLFAGLLAMLMRRFGQIAILAAPFVWIFTEFARYWLTGNNWNAIGYSQAFTETTLSFSKFGGVSLVGFLPLLFSSIILSWLSKLSRYYVLVAAFFIALVFSDLNTIEPISKFNGFALDPSIDSVLALRSPKANVVAIQPNVPMSGLNYEKWRQLRQKHVDLAELGLSQLPAENRPMTTVVFPESPMNFIYDEDPEFQQFVSTFAAKNDVNVLFNSAEPDPENKRYFNSAVLVNSEGREIAQYDKIYLVPFGESVPAPLQSIVPAFVGSFSYGKEYDLLPLGDAKAGVMICFESHFGELSREYIRNGADVMIELTNDGYLGPTPVLRQHLANAVFRAVETNRPVLRVTNVGITAYINERGEVLDASDPYTETTRVWSVAKSDGGQTFYVKNGDWFAWICSIVTLALIGLSFIRRRKARNSE
ncbi:MAG: apolipoprotein N-acyltransferase [Acidobacteria bacterium]|nr:apolipoprotein N-acyltransferase [Acidobacteriota bacterium]